MRKATTRMSSPPRGPVSGSHGKTLRIRRAQARLARGSAVTRTVSRHRRVRASSHRKPRARGSDPGPAHAPTAHAGRTGRWSGNGGPAGPQDRPGFGPPLAPRRGSPSLRAATLRQSALPETGGGADADDPAPEVGRPGIADRRSATRGRHVPAAAPDDDVGGGALVGACRAVRRRIPVVPVPVRAPLPDVPVHVVEPEGVRRGSCPRARGRCGRRRCPRSIRTGGGPPWAGTTRPPCSPRP